MCQDELAEFERLQCNKKPAKILFSTRVSSYTRSRKHSNNICVQGMLVVGIRFYGMKGATVHFSHDENDTIAPSSRA